MITILRTIGRSICLLFGATYVMFYISTCASTVPIDARVHLSVEHMDKQKLQARILERVRYSENGDTSTLRDGGYVSSATDEQLLELSFDILYLQLTAPSFWNRTKQKMLPVDVRRKIRQSAEYRKQIELPTPLKYLSKISNPKAFSNFEFVKATALFSEGKTQSAIDGYRKALDSSKPLALINLASLLISQKKELDFIIDRLKEELEKNVNSQMITDLITLRLGEAYIADRQFTEGISYISPLTAKSSGNVNLVERANLELTKLREHGLDMTYWGWVSRVFRWDLGRSVSSGKEIGPQLKSHLSKTSFLTLITTLLIFFLILPIGIFMGMFHDSKLTRFSKWGIYLISGIPVFLVGYLCLRWFKPNPGSLEYYLIMAICLAFGSGLSYQILMRIQRETRNLLSSDFFIAIKVRRTKWLWQVWHLIKNLIWPSVSTFVSYFPLLLSGAIVVEVVFTYEGIGYYIFSAVRAKDFPVVLPACALLVFLVCVANICRDSVQYLVDPRLRH